MRENASLWDFLMVTLKKSINLLWKLPVYVKKIAESLLMGKVDLLIKNHTVNFTS